MPRQQFALDPGGPKRLVIEWKGIFKNTTVSVDGQVLGQFDSKAAFEQGGTWSLPDGRSLSIRLEHKIATGPIVHVLLDGKPLTGSAGDPQTRLKSSAGIVFFVGGLTTAVSLIAELANVQMLKSLGMGWITLTIGLVFIALGFGVLKRSTAALAAAVTLYSLDIVMSVVAFTENQKFVTGIVIKVFLLLAMCQGFGAIKELKKGSEPIPQHG